MTGAEIRGVLPHTRRARGARLRDDICVRATVDMQSSHKHNDDLTQFSRTRNDARDEPYRRPEQLLPLFDNGTTLPRPPVRPPPNVSSDRTRSISRNIRHNLGSPLVSTPRGHDHGNAPQWYGKLVFPKEAAHLHAVVTVARWGDYKTFLHLALHTQLLREDDSAGRARAHDHPEEERGGDRRGVVGGEDEMDEEEGDGEVEDESRAANERVEVVHAGSVRVSTKWEGRGKGAGTYSAADAAIQQIAMIQQRTGSTLLRPPCCADPSPTCLPPLQTEFHPFQGPSPGRARVVGLPAISRQSRIMPGETTVSVRAARIIDGHTNISGAAFVLEGAGIGEHDEERRDEEGEGDVVEGLERDNLGDDEDGVPSR